MTPLRDTVTPAMWATLAQPAAPYLPLTTSRYICVMVLPDNARETVEVEAHSLPEADIKAREISKGYPVSIWPKGYS